MTTPNSTLANQLEPLAADLANQLEPLAADLANIQDNIATLQLQEATLKRKIRESVPGPDTYTAGNLTVIVSTNRRFNPEQAKQVIPSDLLPLVSVTTSVVDKERVKVLCPDQYEDCFVTYDNVVKLR